MTTQAQPTEQPGPLIRIDLPQLLPDVPNSHDACVARVIALIERRPGITRVHVPEDAAAPALCLHYDANTITLGQVERLAHVAGGQITHRFGHTLLRLRAIAGEDAARGIENGLRSVDGVLAASVNMAAQQARVEWDRTRTDQDLIAAAVRRMGYDVGANTPAAHDDHAPNAGWYGRNKELAWSIIAGALLLAAWVGENYVGLPHAAAVAIYLAAYAFGGYDLVRHAWGELRHGTFTFRIDLLMLLAAAGAAALGAWAEGAFLLFLFSLAHAGEHYALGRARNAIKALSDLVPATARVVRNGREADVPVADIAPGEIVMVAPGERIAVDGTVRAGRSAVNQAPITGESLAVEKASGSEVYAGTVNGDGALELRTTRAAGDRTLDRVIRLVEEAQTQKAPTQRFTDRFERIFVPGVLVAVVLVILVPALAGWLAWSESFYRGMALLVAASPCALALGTPAAVLAGIAQAARNGVLVKGGAYLEQLGSVRALALDKTGTITTGTPTVTDLIPAPGVGEHELLAVAAAVEHRSQHPLAQAVVRRAHAAKIDLPHAHDVQSVTGRGVRAQVAGQPAEVGSLRWWETEHVPVPEQIQAAVEQIHARGSSAVAVRHGERFLGVLGIADQPRAGVASVLHQLRALGVNTVVMLTGDNRSVGEAIARQVGIDVVQAELLPEHKAATVQDLLRTHGLVAMVGDGVNDAPALASATVGIAMGGAGTAVALETADVALMADDLHKLPFAVGLSRRARAIIRQNLGISSAVIALLIVATTTGVVGIGPAVVLHEGSTLLVIANALRLLAYHGPAEQRRASATRA